LILGEFEVEAFDKSTNPVLLWTYFLISTLLTMIIMLNMMIAIMRSSYEKVNLKNRKPKN
jgi:hypothetical protein